MEELKITKEKVLQAANQCSAAKEVLKTLFPETFNEENEEKTVLREWEDKLAKFLNGSDTPAFIFSKIPGGGWSLDKAKWIAKKIMEAN